MSKDKSGYTHSASDKALNAEAEAQKMEKSAKAEHAHDHPGHDADAVSRHDDAGKDRMFQGREQHDDADMKSEKNRLAKEKARDDHPTEGVAAVTPSNMHVKQKE
jgi:hypothetical protein